MKMYKKHNCIKNVILLKYDIDKILYIYIEILYL